MSSLRATLSLWGQLQHLTLFISINCTLITCCISVCVCVCVAKRCITFGHFGFPIQTVSEKLKEMQKVSFSCSAVGCVLDAVCL